MAECAKFSSRVDAGGTASEPRRTRAFTLIELLTVVAIILLLMSLLVPGIGRIRALSRRMVCASNMRQLQVAHTLYAGSHDGLMPGANTGGGKDWVAYTGNTSYASRLKALQRGCLWPYLNTPDVYHCPDHPFQDYLRCYSLNNYLNGSGWGYPVRKTVGQIRRPVETISFIEEPDPRKDLMGSWVTGMSDPGKWVDPIGFWHDYGANFAFLDGHTEYWKWEDARTLLIKFSFFVRTPNNDDLLRIKRHLTPGDPQGKVW